MVALLSSAAGREIVNAVYKIQYSFPFAREEALETPRFTSPEVNAVFCCALWARSLGGTSSNAALVAHSVRWLLRGLHKRPIGEHSVGEKHGQNVCARCAQQNYATEQRCQTEHASCLAPLHQDKLQVRSDSFTGGGCSRWGFRWRCAACGSHRRAPPASIVPFRRRGKRNTAWPLARLRF